MVNLEHSVTLKSTRKIGLRSSSRNVNDSQATPSTSGTNEDENCGKKIYLKKNNEGESLSDIIRNIVKEEFKIHESNIKELINSNVKKTNEQFQALFNLTTCSNYSITNYVKIPVFHFLEKVNKGQLKMVNSSYQKWPDFTKFSF